MYKYLMQLSCDRWYLLHCTTTAAAAAAATTTTAAAAITVLDTVLVAGEIYKSGDSTLFS